MLPSSLSVSFFKLLPLPQKFNRFHIPAPSFIKNASASVSSKSQMLTSSLPLPASFFKVLLLLQKFNRFHIPDCKRHNCSLFNMQFYKQHTDNPKQL